MTFIQRPTNPSDDLIAAIKNEIANVGPNQSKIPVAFSEELDEESGEYHWCVYVDVIVPRKITTDICTSGLTLSEALSKALHRAKRELS